MEKRRCTTQACSAGIAARTRVSGGTRYHFRGITDCRSQGKKGPQTLGERAVRRFGEKPVRLIAWCAAALFPLCAFSEPPTSALTVRQLNHREFRAADGAPLDIATIAQTPDGTLWIGGRMGLARFDGVRFARYPQPGEEPLDSTDVASLLVTADGGLWIGFRPDGIAFLRNGRVKRYGVQDGVPRGTVQQLAVDRDGALWVAARTGLARFDGEGWQMVQAPEITSVYGVLADRAGTMWVASVEGLFARRDGESRFPAVDERTYSTPAGIILAETPDGYIWAGANGELVRVASATD